MGFSEEGPGIYNKNYAQDSIELPKMKSTKIDYELVEKLASFGMNNKQIATAIKICQTNFTALLKTDDKLTDAIAAGKSKICLSILAGQLQMALPDPDNGYIGNAAMLKHIGNVHLGQAEHVELDVKENIHVVLTWGNKKLEVETPEEKKE